MAPDSGRRRPALRLTGRRSERGALDRLVTAVRSGESRALVVRGESGIGKTALLEYLADHAPGCRVARAAGVREEMELAFAGLHQLCAPILEHADRLPAPQREALRTAFSLSAGPPPDRFLVALAVLGLLSEAAGERPLICVIDDQQWLDRASAQALGFVARRLRADPVGLVFAARVPGPELAGLPELEVVGLSDDDARALLESALAGPLDAQVRDLIVAETRGNPLALLELPRELTAAELAGGFGLAGTDPLSGRIEASFRRQLDALPLQSQRLLQLAAADPSGDQSLVWQAAERLSLPAHAAEPAVEAGIVEFGAQVRFRHPLMRSAAYWSGSHEDRRQAHAALADVTDPQADPDRRAWHHAQAAPGPTEAVAAELEQSASRAQARGGMAATAAFLERSAALTADRGRRVERTLAAAQANLQAGAFDRALDLLGAAETGPLDEMQGARVDLLRGRIAFASGLGSDAPPLLLKAATRLQPLDVDLARETYLDAWHAALFAGHRAASGDLSEVSRAGQALPAPDNPRRADVLLDGLTLLVSDGPTAAAPVLRQATVAFTDAEIPEEELLRWGWMAQQATCALWDYDSWRAVLLRQLRLARAVGALDQLPILLSQMAFATAWAGDFAAAAELIAETEAICDATGSAIAPYSAMFMASLRGRTEESAGLTHAAIEDASAGGQGVADTWAHWVAAVLCNGLGRYQEALTAARQASEHAHPHVSMWAWPELIEAAVRSGNRQAADDALTRLTGATQAGGTDFGLGIEARCRALLSKDGAAEGFYHEAIIRLGRTPLRPELARAHLLYGEWLRHESRRADAREQLRTAYQVLAAVGMEGFAERARRELQAVGETVRKRTPSSPDTLTPQEAHIARLARDGHTNPEIGAHLLLSARTVEWHLRKIFAKLSITSRRELPGALSALGLQDR